MIFTYGNACVSHGDKIYWVVSEFMLDPSGVIYEFSRIILFANRNKIYIIFFIR